MSSVGMSSVGKVAVVAVAVEAATVAYLILAHAQPHDFFDLRIYRGAIDAWVNGHSLYGYVDPQWPDKGFVYPPFAAICMVPMVVLPFQATGVVLTVLDIGVVAAVVWSVGAPLAQRLRMPRWLVTAAAVPLVVAMQPIHATMGYGQINLFLLGLVYLDVVGLRRGWRAAGVGTGLAAAIKLTPAFFIVYLLVTRRWRAAAVATSTALAATLVAAAMDPRTSYDYWTSALWQTRRVGSPDWHSNQAIAGLLARLANSPHIPVVPWALAVCAVVVFGVWRARAAYRRGEDLVGFTIIALVALLIAPITWSHHMAWLVVAVVVAVERSLGSWRMGVTALAYAALVSEFVYHVPRLPGAHAAHGILPTLAENTYVIALLAVLLVISGNIPPALACRDARRRHF